jgi:hypothetical protein
MVLSISAGRKEHAPGRDDQQPSKHERGCAPHVAWQVSAKPRFSVNLEAIQTLNNSVNMTGVSK